MAAIWRPFFLARLAPGGRRLAVIILLLALLASSSEIAGLVMQAMADAYLQVTVFVAATLAVFYSAEKLFKRDIGAVMAQSAGWQPAIAACT